MCPLISIIIEELTSVPSLSPHPKGANYLTVELITLKGITQALADLFGLTLAVSWKEQAHRTAGGRVTV